MLKLAQGVFVSQEGLEGIYLASPLVEQTFIYATGDKEYVLAVVVPIHSVLSRVLQREAPLAELCVLPEAEQAVLASLQAVAKDAG